MSEAKFTPGPWMHNPQFPTSVWAGDVWIGSANVETVPSMDERTANARMFAAAPDMYADALDAEHAYSWLMQELRDLQHEGASWAPERIGLFADSLIAYCDAHQIGTRAALAKARGEAQ